MAWKDEIKKEDIFDGDALIEKIHNTIQETVRDAKNLDSQYGDYWTELKELIPLLSEAHEIARKMLKETK